MTPFRVGLLTLVALAAFIYLFGSVKKEFDEGDGYSVHATFEDVAGLLPQSRVQMAGINVGQIAKIELKGDRAVVTIRIKEPLYQDATVVKKQASMLGDYYLALIPGDMRKPRLVDGSEIRNVVSSTGVDQIFVDLQAISGDIKEVTQSLRNVMGGPEGEDLVRNMAHNLADTTEAIRHSVTENQDAVSRTLANLDSITSDIRKLTGPSGREIAGILQETHEIVSQVNELLGSRKDELGQSVGSLREAMDKLNTNMTDLTQTLIHARSISEKIDRGEGTLGLLVNDRSLHQDMNGLVNNVNGIVTDVGDFVDSYTRMQTIVGLRSEYAFLSNSMKNYVSIKFQPKPDKYYLLEVIDDPRGKTMVTQTTTRSNDPTRVALAQEERVETTDSLKVSLELAKRYYFLTGRFGIIEGAGGIGMDIHLLDDNLELTTDLFDFGEDLNPRLKFGLSYQFFSHLFLLGGVDDSLNANQRDYYLGAAIRFTDDDLKSLLMAAPSISP